MVQIVDGELEFNETNENARGGTEYIARTLAERLPQDVLDGIQMIHSRPRELYDDMKRIFVVHDLPQDPEVAHLANGGWRDYDKIVFVSYWQQEMYNLFLGVPYSAGCVIRNAINPIKPRAMWGVDGQFRLIYTPTPHRGLDLVVDAYDYIVAESPIPVHLDVFSSFELYGWGSRDDHHQATFDYLRDHPAITYHGTQPNETVRKYLSISDMFVYPSIWQETSCLCLIEAMSAGLTCIHPAYGALTETAGNKTWMYEWTENRFDHVEKFAHNVLTYINRVHKKMIEPCDRERSAHFLNMHVEKHHSWENQIGKWVTMLEEVKGE